MRTFKGPRRGTVALAPLRQKRSKFVLDLSCWESRERLLEPSFERDLGVREGTVAARFAHPLDRPGEPRHRVETGRGDGRAGLRHLFFQRLEQSAAAFAQLE